MDVLAPVKKLIAAVESRIERRAEIRELRTRAWLLDEGIEIAFLGGKARAAKLREQADEMEANKPKDEDEG